MTLLSDNLNAPRRPTKERIATYGKRIDGTPKGAGYFGEIPHPGKPNVYSTELSIGVELDGKEIQIPLLVPTLSKSEIDAVIRGQETESIIRKAVDHAKYRMKQGKSVFAEDNEYHPLPKE